MLQFAIRCGVKWLGQIINIIINWSEVKTSHQPRSLLQLYLYYNYCCFLSLYSVLIAFRTSCCLLVKKRHILAKGMTVNAHPSQVISQERGIWSCVFDERARICYIFYSCFHRSEAAPLVKDFWWVSKSLWFKVPLLFFSFSLTQKQIGLDYVLRFEMSNNNIIDYLIGADT